MKTVKVRVAVVVNDDGKWSAFGDWEMSAKENLDMAACDLPDGKHEARYWVSADLALPEVPEMRGQVEGAKP